METKIHSKKLLFIALGIAFFAVLGTSFYGSREDQVALDTTVDNIQLVQPIPLPRKDTLLVFGDVMLDRYIRNYITASGTRALFEHVVQDINNADTVLTNLEGPITQFPSVVSKENLQFTFPAHTAQDLADVGIDIVSLANNHTHNFGKEGLRQTREFLDKANVAHFGDPYNTPNKLTTRSVVGSTTISFVGFHQFEDPELKNILEVIRSEKDLGNYVIFFPHWGTEYEKKASTYQQKIAQEVIEAGADVVIGAHPHVIQNIDRYRGKPIFYSLGNFIFDQWFSEDVKYGLALFLTFTENTLTSIELKPFYRNRYQPKWLTDTARETWCKEFIPPHTFNIDQNNVCVLYP